jgi:hypothetical protein
LLFVSLRNNAQTKRLGTGNTGSRCGIGRLRFDDGECDHKEWRQTIQLAGPEKGISPTNCYYTLSAPLRRVAFRTRWAGSCYFSCLRALLADYKIESEHAMSELSSVVKMTKNGIGFSVCVEFVNRDCFISNEALIKLASQMFEVIGPMQTFRELEANITGVARRLVRAGVKGSPLQLTPNTFQ